MEMQVNKIGVFNEENKEMSPYIVYSGNGRGLDALTASILYGHQIEISFKQCEHQLTKEFQTFLAQYIESIQKTERFIGTAVERITRGDKVLEERALTLIKEYNDQQALYPQILQLIERVWATTWDHKSAVTFTSQKFAQALPSLPSFEKIYSEIAEEIGKQLHKEATNLEKNIIQEISKYAEQKILQIRLQQDMDMDPLTEEPLVRAYDLIPMVNEGNTYNISSIKRLRQEALQKNYKGEGVFLHPVSRVPVIGWKEARNIDLKYGQFQAEFLRQLAIELQKDKSAVAPYLMSIQKQLAGEDVQNFGEEEGAVLGKEKISEQDRELVLRAIQLTVVKNQTKLSAVLVDFLHDFRDDFFAKLKYDNYIGVKKNSENTEDKYVYYVDEAKKVFVEYMIKNYWHYIDRKVLEEMKEFLGSIKCNFNQPIEWNHFEFEEAL